MIRSERAGPNYGIDAPATIRTYVLVGFGLALAGRLVASLRIGGLAARLTPALLTLAGAASFGFAGSMLAYASRGKPAFRDRLLEMIDWRGDENVLDIGTGRGWLLIGAAKRLTAGSAMGIDAWTAADGAEHNIERALRNAEIEGVRAKVRVKSEDVRRLSFADNSFDVVLSALYLHTIADRDGRTAACREIARVLKPGGTVLLADFAATRQYERMLGAAGLVAERSGPYLRESFTYLRVVAATKAA